MRAGEDEFVKRRIYLPLERSRDLAIRTLFRKVFLAGGLEPSPNGGPPIRRTRVPVTEFIAAMRMSVRTPEEEEEEREEERKKELERLEGKTKKKADKEKEKKKRKKIDRDEVECFLSDLIYKVSVDFSPFLLFSWALS